ncbi:MAG: molecular chaperone DnaJ [Candidatus Aminicenantes bacterium]|nr:molecular chaperone DnaJ [Candidatus Aminicenantes bacterium]NIM77835.1 molecular chaperone DnaJ [Candidatus Aminicenantes bacterium]NIN17147.1 molecular chaperone DnaJ [Candidatus Aminicenantes bacterium]NIN41040.1 molecular chaperone DnaJ [Candidatus Aminicenantes bacterium]NIN83845.1 molecular chaperone DnaJ [Candidatus Aminicenantes bacterium]
MNDYYKTLGINKKASLSDIKRAYRKLARKYHPDLNPGDKAAERSFKEITEAYEVLRDPEKRKQYDMFGSVGRNFRTGKRGSPFDGFDFTTTGSSTFGDIFQTIFGGGGPFSQTQNKQQRRPEQGEDLRYSINLSFMDAAQGIETPIQLVRQEVCSDCGGKGIERNSSRVTCPRCHGSGKIDKQTGFMKFSSACPGCGGSGYLPGRNCSACGGEGRVDKVSKIRARIPAGVDNNSKVRIHGKGNAGRFGGPAGDLIISINVTTHKFFKRNGANLEIILPITYLEAAMGAKVEVPTLDGSTLLKIPPGTSSGQKLRLRGKGVANPKARGKGDLIIEIKIVPPPTKDLEVRRLLQKIEKKAPYNPRKDMIP